MSESRPSLTPGEAPRAANAASGGSSPSVPTAAPPATAAGAKAGCGCEGKAAAASAASPATAALPPAFETASLAAPSLLPGSAGVGAVTATWRNNARFTGMWSINQDRNCWAHLDAIGWRGLSTVSESGLVSMNMLASHAYQQGAVVNCYEGDDGRISQLYVW